MKKFIILAIFSLGYSLAQAQLLSVTATLTDSAGQTWTNATCSIQTYNTSGGNSYYNGTAIPNTPACSVNGSGVLSASLYNTSTLAPVSSQYRFTIQSNTSAQAITFLTPVTAANMSSTLSALLTAPRFPAGYNAYGYADGEVYPATPLYGQTYYNVSTPAWRQYTALGWTTVGSGGSGAVTSVFARIGDVAAQSSDYSAYYCVLTGCTLTGPLVATSGVFGTPSIAAKAALPTGAHGWSGDESATAGVPASGVDYCRFDSTTHTPVCSFNGAAETAWPTTNTTWSSVDGPMSTAALGTTTTPTTVMWQNTSGSTRTVTAITCYVDAGSGTVFTLTDRTNNLLGATGTCSTSGTTIAVSGTHYTISSGGVIVNTFTPDSTVKSISLIVSGN